MFPDPATKIRHACHASTDVRRPPCMSARRHWAAGILRQGDLVLLCHHRRGRASHPGVWDLPGGHVRPGEPPHHAVGRELWEELGIVVDPRPTPYASVALEEGTLHCWVLRTWQGVVSNTAPEEHDALRWCGREDVRRLPLADDGLRQLLLAHLSPERVHCVALLDGPPGHRVDDLRATWDPRRARGVPVHVTLTYPEELDLPDGLIDRVAASAAIEPAFAVRLGDVVGVEGGLGGVMVEVEDLDGGWGRVRDGLLHDRPRLLVDPHVTIAHPDSSPDPVAAWRGLRGSAIGGIVVVRELLVVRTADCRTTILGRHRLRGGPSAGPPVS